MTVPTGVPTANTTAGAIDISKANSALFKPFLPFVTATARPATGARPGFSAGRSALTLNVPEIKACCHNQALFCAGTVMAFTVGP